MPEFDQRLNQEIDKCLEILHAGGTILYPTDTVWGIGCDATNEKAVEKVMAIKQRDPHKSFVVLVADENEVHRYVDAPDPAIFAYLQQLHQPTTVIYENAQSLARNIIADEGTIAIRICKDQFCNQLIKNFGKPIVSSSANISGQPTPASFSMISPLIKSGVDYVTGWRQDEENTTAVPSAIIRWKNGVLDIIRR